MSVACDPTSLVSGAVCLECGIPPGLQKPIIISLLCKIANMNCDPTSLIAGAACLECGIPPGMQDAITNYLLCQIANIPAPAPAPVTQSAAYPLTDGAIMNINFAHGLSPTPSFVRAVLLCTAPDTNSGIISGQEVPIETVFSDATSVSPFSAGADAKNIYVNYDGESTAGGNQFIHVLWGGSVNQFSSFNNFSLKVYYHA